MTAVIEPYTVVGPQQDYTRLGNTTTAHIIPPPGPTDFDRLPPQLRGMQTHSVYLGPNNSMFNLAGSAKGLQGVRFVNQVGGDQAWPIEQVLSRSPYVMGADIQRTNIGERLFKVGIIIGSQTPPMTEYQYRMAEANWWAGQDENNDGWLGFYTRFSGWRWIPVRPFRTVETPQKADPTAYGNNASMWDIEWIGARPYFTKVALYDSFQALHAGAAKPPPGSLLGGFVDQLVGHTFYWGTITLANRGDLMSWAQFFVTSPGQAIVQDNDSARLVPLPTTNKSVGTYMCDTAPGVRTLTAANDPQDNLLFDLIRQSQILNSFLSGVSNIGLPLQLQFNNRFIYGIPPKTVVQLTVGHSNVNGSITALVPQRYKRSR
jgi:hypothetical protein